MKVFIAIDPGSVGGIVTGKSNESHVVAYAMPETEQDVVDVLREIIENARFEGLEVVCTIEKVSGYAGGDGQPGSAMFSFGRGDGIIYGALMYPKIVKIQEVTPQKWQKALSLGHKEHAKMTMAKPAPYAKKEVVEAYLAEKKRVASLNAKYKTAWKNKLKAEAQRLFPSIKVTLKTADALLIYEYAKKESTGSNKFTF